nr:reverse transcriptase domain-containing protein [Tanacetum cinerariifolium]
MNVLDSNFNLGSTICKNIMFHVPAESNKFEGEIIPCNDSPIALKDDPTSPEVDQSYVDTEGDILLLKAFFNDDPSLPPPNQGNYLPQVQKELKICEVKFDKYLSDEPLDVELKDLPPHLEYAFWKVTTSFQS